MRAELRGEIFGREHGGIKAFGGYEGGNVRGSDSGEKEWRIDGL